MPPNPKASHLTSRASSPRRIYQTYYAECIPPYMRESLKCSFMNFPVWGRLKKITQVQWDAIRILFKINPFLHDNRQFLVLSTKTISKLLITMYSTMYVHINDIISFSNTRAHHRKEYDHFTSTLGIRQARSSWVIEWHPSSNTHLQVLSWVLDEQENKEFSNLSDVRFLQSNRFNANSL